MRQHSALILEPETDGRGVERAAFDVRTLEYYHRIPIHYENRVNLGHPHIHIWNLSTYDTQAIKTQ